MELLQLPRNAALTLLLFLLAPAATLVLSYTHTQQFTPTDNYLINCGSSDASSATHHIDNRIFAGDQLHHHTHSSSFRLVSSSSSSYLADSPTSSPNSSNPIYLTSRVFRSASAYRFSIRQKGTHILRLHFQDNSRLPTTPLFRVYAGDFLLIAHGVHHSTNPNPIVKEFFIWVDEDELEIKFLPNKGSVAYVNAIELISAPSDLIADAATLLVAPPPAAQPRMVFHGLTGQAMETLYRINVGGPKVTPFNDTLWRTWLPDDQFLTSQDSASTTRVYSTGPIKYSEFGASRQVGPDNVYNTARAITSENMPSIPNLNITWTFPVEEGYRYLVRLHFCDIASMALDMLYFNVYVNGLLAYENLDLSSVTSQSLASPYYADFVVNGCGLDRLSVSVGPSELSKLHSVDAILNGVEIMKISNSMKSLDGDFGMHGKGSVRVGICDALPMVAVICLLVLMSMVIKKRLNKLNDSRFREWLSLGGSNAGAKYSSIPLAGKI